MFAQGSENSYNSETNLLDVTALPGHLPESPATTGDRTPGGRRRLNNDDMSQFWAITLLEFTHPAIQYFEFTRYIYIGE